MSHSEALVDPAARAGVGSDPTAVRPWSERSAYGAAIVAVSALGAGFAIAFRGALQWGVVLLCAPIIA